MHLTLFVELHKMRANLTIMQSVLPRTTRREIK